MSALLATLSGVVAAVAGSASISSLSGMTLAVGGAQVGDGEFGVVFEGLEGFVAEEVLINNGSQRLFCRIIVDNYYYTNYISRHIVW